MTSNPFLVFGVVVILGVAMNFLRLWTFMSGGARAARLTRISSLDSHLSFDERIAERMREMERENKGSAAAPSVAPVDPPPAPKGFGRRGT